MMFHMKKLNVITIHYPFNKGRDKLLKMLLPFHSNCKVEPLERPQSVILIWLKAKPSHVWLCTATFYGIDQVQSERAKNIHSNVMIADRVM